MLTKCVTLIFMLLLNLTKGNKNVKMILFNSLGITLLKNNLNQFNKIK